MGELKDILLNFGAIAGFAGIIGLAVLAMLYFSQARDVRRLREWAGREPERAAEVELRAQQIASQAIAQAYESMAYRQSEAQAAANIAQDAGVIAEAPLVAMDAAASESAAPEEAEQLEAAPEGAAAEAEPAEAEAAQETQAHDVVAHEFGGEEAAPGEAEAETGVEQEESQVEQPYEVAAAANTSAGDTVVHPAPPAEPGAEEAEPESGQSRLSPSTPAAARAAAPLPPLPPLDTSEFAPVSPPITPPTTPPIPDYYLATGTTGSGHFEPIDATEEHRSRVPFAVAGVLVAIFAVILISTQLLGGDNTDTKGGTGGSPNNRPSQNTSEQRNPRINRAAVTVAVLNGTDTAGIAATAAAGLQSAGFSDTTTGNLSDGTVHTTSTVYYAPGSKQEAQEVAKELAITDIKPATDTVIAAGGSVPVIVVLGANFQQ